MGIARTRIMAASMAAMFLIVSAFVLMPADEVEGAGVYTGGANTSTPTSPYDSVSGEYSDLSAPQIYVRLGGTADIRCTYDASEGDLMGGGYAGLTEDPDTYGYSGTFSRVGTYSLEFFHYGEGEVTWQIHVAVVPVHNMTGNGTAASPYSGEINRTLEDFNRNNLYFAKGTGIFLDKGMASGAESRGVTFGFGLQSFQGTLSGTLNKVGSFSVSVYYHDTNETETYTWHCVEAVQPMSITSTPMPRAISGRTWGYTPTVSEPGAVISVSGASWLTSNGTTVSGTAPAVSGESQTFDVVITAAKAGFTTATQDVTLTVHAENGWTTVPTPEIHVTPLGGKSFRFSAEGSQHYNSILWDLGDGTTSNALILEHTFASGSYDVSLTASNQIGDASMTTRILVADDSMPAEAQYSQLYSVTIEHAVGSAVPAISGCPWLSVSSYGPDFVTVSGIPASVAYVGRTYDAVLTIGDETIEWSVTVVPGAAWPRAGFTATVDGLSVTLTSTAANADRTYYVFYEGGREILTSTAVTNYLYTSPGTYVITQIVRTTVDGQEVVDTYSRSVTVSSSGPSPGPEDEDGGEWYETHSAALIVLAFAILSVIAVARTGNVLIGLAVFAVLYVIAGIMGAVWWP